MSPSFVEGYVLKDGEVALDVDGSKFALFTKDDSAWARTSELDKTIVAALAKGKQAVVKGVLQRPADDRHLPPARRFRPGARGDRPKACGVKR